MDSYEISSSSKQRSEFKKLCEQARSEDRLADAARAAKEIIARLQADPTIVGELLFHLKHWKLPVRHVVEAPWSLHFAVDEKRRIVYLRRMSLLAVK